MGRMNIWRVVSACATQRDENVRTTEDMKLEDIFVLILRGRERWSPPSVENSKLFFGLRKKTSRIRITMTTS
jgi:hypothetical protein